MKNFQKKIRKFRKNTRVLVHFSKLIYQWFSNNFRSNFVDYRRTVIPIFRNKPIKQKNHSVNSEFSNKTTRRWWESKNGINTSDREFHWIFLPAVGTGSVNGPPKRIREISALCPYLVRTSPRIWSTALLLLLLLPWKWWLCSSLHRNVRLADCSYCLRLRFT